MEKEHRHNQILFFPVGIREQMFHTHMNTTLKNQITYGKMVCPQTNISYIFLQNKTDRCPHVCSFPVGNQ